MTRFWLARHGETDWNLEGRFQGQADPPLNAKGLEQAHTLADRLAGEGIEAIYCSDLQRARRTAQIIGKRLGLKPKVDKRLREISLGAWEGMKKEQIQSAYAELWQRRKLDPLNVPAPGGENLLEVAGRIEQAADQIAGEHGNATVLLIAHGVTIACLICRVRDLPLTQALHLVPDNAHPIQVEWH